MTGAQYKLSREEQIEGALARGRSWPWIRANLGVTDREIRGAMQRMDRAIEEDPWAQRQKTLGASFFTPEVEAEVRRRHAEYQRHKSRGTKPSRATLAGERTYQALRHIRRQAMG